MEYYGFRSVAKLPDGTGKYRVRYIACAEGMSREGAEDTMNRHEGYYDFPREVIGPMTKEQWETFGGTGYADASSLDAPHVRAKWESIFGVE